MPIIPFTYHSIDNCSVFFNCKVFTLFEFDFERWQNLWPSNSMICSFRNKATVIQSCQPLERHNHTTTGPNHRQKMNSRLAFLHCHRRFSFIIFSNIYWYLCLAWQRIICIRQCQRLCRSRPISRAHDHTSIEHSALALHNRFQHFRNFNRPEIVGESHCCRAHIECTRTELWSIVYICHFLAWSFRRTLTLSRSLGGVAFSKRHIIYIGFAFAMK